MKLIRFNGNIKVFIMCKRVLELLKWMCFIFFNFISFTVIYECIHSHNNNRWLLAKQMFEKNKQKIVSHLLSVFFVLAIIVIRIMRINKIITFLFLFFCWENEHSIRRCCCFLLLSSSSSSFSFSFSVNWSFGGSAQKDSVHNFCIFIIPYKCMYRPSGTKMKGEIKKGGKK